MAGVHEFSLDSISSCSFVLYVCSILLDECDTNLVYELNSKNGSWSNSRFRDQIACMLANGSVYSTTWQLFVKLIQLGILCFKEKAVISPQIASEQSSHPCFNFISRVIDRGKEFQLIEGFSYLVDEGYFDTTTSPVIVLGSVLMETYNEDWVCELVMRLAYPSDLRYMDSLVLLCINGADISGILFLLLFCFYLFFI